LYDVPAPMPVGMLFLMYAGGRSKVVVPV